MGTGSKIGKHQGASAISDRSGFRFPMNEMVVEQGTGWLVHRSETDGEYSLVTHPLNNIGRYIKDKSGDPFPVKNARPRPETELESGITVHSFTCSLGAMYVLRGSLS